MLCAQLMTGFLTSHLRLHDTCDTTSVDRTVRCIRVRVDLSSGDVYVMSLRSLIPIGQFSLAKSYELRSLQKLMRVWMARAWQPVSHDEIKPTKATIIRVTKAQD